MSSPATDAPRGGVIYDIGYRHYDGTRNGRAAAIYALYAQGLRTIFGLGRGERAKFIPWGLFAAALLPAIVDAGVAAFSNNAAQLIPHHRYFRLTWPLIALFCAAQAPELMGSDQVHRVLTLYFSRPLRRIDYALARWLSLVSATLAVVLIPQLVLFFARVMVAAAPWQKLREDVDLLVPIVGSAVLIAVLLAGIATLLSAVISRRVYATAAILGVLLLSAAGSTAMVQLSPERFGHAVLASPTLVSQGTTAWLFEQPLRPRSTLGRARLDPPVYGRATLIFAAASFGLLVLRYRRIAT